VANRISSYVFSLFLLWPALAAAQDYLLNESSVVMRHDKRQSFTKFEVDLEKNPLSAWGMYYFNENDEDLSKYVLSYDALPKCERSDVLLIPVGGETPGTETHDVIYYDSDDVHQSAKAKEYQGDTPVIAYEAAFAVDPQTGSVDKSQQFARFLGIPCLPARFHFVYVGSKRYAEYRIGEEAWK